jgi:hypothetical protein
MTDLLVGLVILASAVALAVFAVFAVAAWVGWLPVCLLGVIAAGLVWLNREKYG